MTLSIKLFQGAQGVNGSKGLPGERGQSGRPGVKGMNGLPGLMGAEGNPGRIGRPGDMVKLKQLRSFFLLNFQDIYWYRTNSQSIKP